MKTVTETAVAPKQDLARVEPEVKTTVSDAKKKSWLVSRIARGLAQAYPEYRSWLKATEYDSAVDLAKDGKDQARLIVAMRDREIAQGSRKAKTWWRISVVVPLVFGGALGATVLLSATAVVAMLVTALMEKLRGKKTTEKASTTPRAEHSSAVLHRILVATVLSGALTFADWYLHLPSFALLVWPAGVALITLIVLIIWVGPDGSIADNLADKNPEPGELTENSIVAALKASHPQLRQHADPMVVAPGVDKNTVPGVWTATLSTAKGGQGPSAKPILAVRDDFASELGVAPNRLYLEVDENIGSRLNITAVTGKPWESKIRSPLLDVKQVDLWDGIPFGTNIMRQRVSLPIEQRLWLFGGSSGGGKSTATTVVDAGFLLSKYSKLWIIDGGDVDTAAIDQAGMAHRYATAADHGQALLVLQEYIEELERRQKLLAKFGEAHRNDNIGKKISRQFFEEHGLGFDLLHFDEFGSFTNSSDKQLSKDITKAVMTIIQRGRKVGLVPLLSTQSPSASTLDSDARDVINDRYAVWCNGWQMSEKILGQGNRSRGIDASALKQEDKAGWLCASGQRAQVVRADFLEESDMALILAQAKKLRGSVATVRNLREVPTLLLATAQLMRQHEVDKMPTEEVVGRLQAAGHRLDDRLQVAQRELAAEMKRVGVAPFVDNTRASENRGKSHYLLSDVDEALHRLGHAA